MKILHTPEDRFRNIPDYPFESHFVKLGEGIQMHYVDEGPKNGQIILLMHGEPSWSFLYRKMIPVFVKTGFRVLAPDLIGFGKSSKLVDQSEYTYARHLNWCLSWLKSLDLRGINFFGQDWGGLIGLRLVTAEPDRFDRIVVANTGLPTGDHSMPEAFLQWQAFSKKVDVLPIARILQNSTVRTLTEEELAAYEAPFPSPEYQAGAKIFPSLVPTTTDDPENQNNRDAWQVLMKWEKPLLTLFSDSDPITRGGEAVFQKLVKGAQGQPHEIIKGGGHFLQEDKGEEIAQKMVHFIQTT